MVDKPTKGRQEGNVLFNDALNIFYLRLYGVGYMVEAHSDSERGNPLPPHELLFLINSKCSFYMHNLLDRIAYTTAFVTPVGRGALAGTRNSSIGLTHEGSTRRPIAP